EILRIVPGAARQVLPAAGRERLGCARERLDEAAIAGDRLGLVQNPEPRRARLAAIALLHGMLEHAVQALEHLEGDVAELEEYLGASRNDGRCAGIERDAAGGPGRARPAMAREFQIDGGEQPDGREPGIAALRHGGAARMILLTLDDDAVLPDRNDAG